MLSNKLKEMAFFLAVATSAPLLPLPIAPFTSFLANTLHKNIAVKSKYLRLNTKQKKIYLIGRFRNSLFIGDRG